MRERQDRTIGLEQITTTVLALATFPKDYSDYIPFRVEIWDANEPDAPPVTERRRTKRKSS